MKRLVLVCALALWAASSALAEPYYGVLFGQSCFLCHQNPAGRGLRSTYGSQFFAPRYSSLLSVPDSMLAKYTPQLSPSVLIGVDFRQIWMAEDAPVKGQRSGFSAPFSTNTGSDAEMAASIYLAFQPTDKIALRYTQDLKNMLRWEAYGIAYLLPLHGYVKAGQFQENYGWAFADHSAYVRTGLWEGYTGGVSGANPPIPPRYGAGGEIGLAPSHLTFSASFTDDADMTYIPGPQDMQKRWVGRIMAQEGIQKMGLEFSAGASGWYAPAFSGDPSGLRPQQRWWGGFGGIGWQGIPDKLGCSKGFGFLTTSLLFEYDRKAWQPYWSSASVTSAYSTTQLSVMAQPGVWVVGAYDWLDNTGKKDGNEGQRYSVGLQVFPWPWVDLMPMYRLYKPPTVGGTPRNIRHFEVQAHFLF